jgi:hypothetical protein
MNLSGYPQPNPSGYVDKLDLTTSGSSVGPITLSSGSWLELDVYVYIPEDTSPSQVTAKLLLVYTPSSTETPP